MIDMTMKKLTGTNWLVVLRGRMDILRRNVWSFMSVLHLLLHLLSPMIIVLWDGREKIIRVILSTEEESSVLDIRHVEGVYCSEVVKHYVLEVW
jgi:hypothetical protein